MAIRKGSWKLIWDFETGQKELYKLDIDPMEQSNVADLNAQMTRLLEQELANHIQETYAFLPKKDPLYDPKKASQWLLFSRTKRLETLERARMDFLSKDFDPENQWWGSEVGMKN